MRIAFYAPFKPLRHPQPSGDLIIARGLHDYLLKQGHAVRIASSLRLRWIFWKAWRWPQLLKERRKVLRSFNKAGIDIWLTYHTYYKAPDLLGPFACRRLKLPYVIFQGIYSTKRRRRWQTWPGFIINKRALCAARYVFTNRREDHLNLKRIIPDNRLTYVAPGIYPEEFAFDANARSELRGSWKVGDDPVIVSAAMFRPGVKSKGLAWLIRACSRLSQTGRNFHLVIAGEGRENNRLRRLAGELLPGKARFVGKIPRTEMNRFYSAGDVFAFPGIRETLGMVYLEAQSCGIPVIAFANGGIPEVVKDKETGFLVPMYAEDAFARTMDALLSNQTLREEMGRSARTYVLKNHDLNRNYQKVEKILDRIVKAFSNPYDSVG